MPPPMPKYQENTPCEIGLKNAVQYVKFYYQFTTHNEKQSGCGVSETWQCNNTALSFEKEERQQMETYSKYLSSHRDYTITFAPNSKN